jgi:AcrR family transcriptional regulator
VNRSTSTKEAILESALYLFHLKGFHATSVRDIAQKANVNSANIAYYFKNKQGLLEFCLTTYLEEYLELIERNIHSLEIAGPRNCLLALVAEILEFQRKNFLAAGFIYGESSLDSSLNREILSTYYMKEKFYLQMILEKGITEKVFQPVSIPLFILQLKGMLSAPIMHSNYAREVLYLFSNEPYYTAQYRDQLSTFLQFSLFKDQLELAATGTQA